MRKRCQRLLGLSALLGAFVAAPATAQPYAGGNLGKGDVRADSINGVAGDSSGTAFKAYGGYRFHPNFALEAGGASLGRFGPDGRVRAGFVDAVGMLPISESWTALGRLGVAQTRVTAGGARDSGTSPKVGLGAQYNLSPTTAIRGEWERYRLDAFGAKSNADMVSLGVNVGF